MAEQPTDGERFDHGPATGPISFTPPPDTPQVTAMRTFLSVTLQRRAMERRSAIEAACYVALDVGCGVRVDDYDDAGWSVLVDRGNPTEEIREYRHAHPQPFKDQDYRHPGCVNCDSLLRDRAR